MRDYGFFVLHVVLHKRCFDYSIKRLTNLSIFAMREKMKQKTFDDPYSFFSCGKYSNTVELEVLYHNSSVSVASAKAQVSITTLLQ